MARIKGPDQGYAWVILTAVCIIYMIANGLMRTSGIFYVAVIKEYGVSREEATTPFALQNSLRLAGGFVAGLVGQVLGIKTISFWGGVVMAAGASMCTIAPNILWLTIFCGGVQGIGFAFVVSLLKVVINQYFEKYRATASGIAMAGPSVSSVFFPFLFEYLVDFYGLSGAFLLSGGVLLNMLPLILLLRCPPWLEKNTGKEKPVDSYTVDTQKPQVRAQDEKNVHAHNGHIGTRTNSSGHCPESGDLQVVVAEKKWSNVRSPIFSKKTLYGHDNPAFLSEEKCPVTCLAYRTMEADVITSINNSVGSNSSVRGEGDEHSHQKHPPTTVDRYQQASMGPEVLESANEGYVSALISSILVYKNPMHMLICLSMFLHVLIFGIVNVIIGDYGQDKGMSESCGKYLLGALAVGDIIGRLCFGWVTDGNLMSEYKFMALCHVFQGGLVVLICYANSLLTLMAVLTANGIFGGTLLIHLPTLVPKYVSMERQFVAVGGMGFLSGVGSFGIPPLIGHFRDDIGSYDEMFYWFGGTSVVFAAVWLLEPMAVKMAKLPK